MPFSSLIDWLTVSWRATRDLTEIIPQHAGFVITNELPTLKHYDNTYQMECGGLLSVSRNDVQGVKMELSGQPLLWLRQNGFSQEMQIEMAKIARRCTRIDYAIDIKQEDKKYCPESVLVAYKRGKIKTRMIPNRLILNLKSNGGRSVYWGGEKSDNQIRVYDKAREMGLLWEAWCRVEMQIRGRSADALAYDMSSGGIDRAGTAKLRKIFNPVSTFWLSDVVKINDFKPTKIRRKQTSFEAWIEKTISPAFEKHMLIPSDKKLILELASRMFDIAEKQDYY